MCVSTEPMSSDDTKGKHVLPQISAFYFYDKKSLIHVLINEYCMFYSFSQYTDIDETQRQTIGIFTTKL